MIVRRDLKALLNQFAQYELCFGNKFNINPAGYNVKSTGFTINGFNDTAYITDIPNKNTAGNLDGSNMGTLSVVTKNNKGEQRVIVKDAGVVDYKKGEVILQTSFPENEDLNCLIKEGYEKWMQNLLLLRNNSLEITIHQVTLMET